MIRRERRIEAIHVAPLNHINWGVRLSGRKRSSTVHRTRGGAISCGRSLAHLHGVTLVVHRADGTVDYKVPPA